MADLIAEGRHKGTITAFALRNVQVRGKTVQVLDITASLKETVKTTDESGKVSKETTRTHNVRTTLFLATDDGSGNRPCSRDANFKRLRDIGWNGEPDAQFRGLVGASVEVEVEHKANGGKVYANGKYINPAPRNSVDMGAARALFGDNAKSIEDKSDDVPF